MVRQVKGSHRKEKERLMEIIQKGEPPLIPMSDMKVQFTNASAVRMKNIKHFVGIGRSGFVY